MGRRFFALTAACAAVLLAGLRSGAAAPAPLEPFAGLEEPGEVRPAGTLLVDGKPVEASRFTTDSSADAVIARHHAAFEGAPVDFAERQVGDARLLSILDVPGGRHLVVIARPLAGGAEVIRGWGPLGGSHEPVPAAPLPDGWLAVARVEDRLGGILVLHRTALAPTGAEQARAALARMLGAAGWRHEPGSVERFARENATLEASFEEGPGGTAVQLLQREEAAR